MRETEREDGLTRAEGGIRYPLNGLEIEYIALSGGEMRSGKERGEIYRGMTYRNDVRIR